MNGFPTHRDLEHTVQLTKRKIRRNQNPPPHHRADAEQPYFDLHDVVGRHCGRQGTGRRNGWFARSRHLGSLLPVPGIRHEHPTLPYALLLEWQAMAEGAYSANTLRAQKADGAIFQTFCESRGQAYLPADPKTIRAFIDDRVKAGKKPATVKRYIATIARVHIAAGLLNPCSSEAVRLGLKKMGRETAARQDQAHPMGWKDIKEFIDGSGEGLRADRERAMLCVAY